MPRIETVIQENDGKVHLAKVRNIIIFCVFCDEYLSRLSKSHFMVINQVDIDELTDIADDFEIQSVPVLIVIKDGKVKEKMVGCQDTDKIRTWLQRAIK